MKKLKSSSFSFIRNFLLIILFSCAVFTNGFFIGRVFALGLNITQLNFTTAPQTIDPNIFSSILTVQTQNIDGVSESTSETTRVVLSSSSDTGEFYNANASTKTCTTLLSEPFTITISSGSSNKSFCYKDSTSGTHTINISVVGKDWVFGSQDIIITGDEEEEPPQNIYTEITEDITSDTIWTFENSPYVISSNIHIVEGATLDIQVGSIVKFENSGALIVDGALLVNGTIDSPVYFTSINDDTIGGDTNDDGESVGSDGDWEYILFKSLDQESHIDHSIVKYSSSGIISYYSTPLNISNLDIDNEILYFGSSGNLEAVKSKGLYLYDGSDLVVKDSEIKGQDKNLILVESKSKLNLSNSNILGDYNTLINIYGESDGDFDNVSISNTNTNGIAISLYLGSNLNLKYSDISSNYDGFMVYDHSSLGLIDSNITCDHNGLYLYNNSILNMDGVSVSCLSDGLMLYDNVDTQIINSKISNSLDVGILVFDNDVESNIDISKSEIFNNEYGFVVFGSSVKAHNNYIHDNFSYGVFTPVLIDLDFTSNFWGDKTGPIHSSNVSGLGDSISDHILYSPFLKYNPLEKRKDPVILIPGITGTYLYKDYDDYGEIWPNLLRLMSPTSITDEFLTDLFLNEDGTENSSYHMNIGDIIRGVITVHIFDKMIEEFENNGYVENENLFVFPYDWRFSTFKSSDLLKDKVDNILSNGEYEKIDIVAHSMGGLVAKGYISKYGKDKIDQLIFLGTPQLGAPKAFKVLGYGDSMGFKKIFFGLNKEIAKFMSQNMPSVYELLPSRKYIDKDEGYIIDDRNKEFIRLNYDQTKNLMIENGRNPLMYPFAEDLHSTIDYLDLSDIESYNFVGCGFGTIGGIKFTRKLSWKKLFLEEKDDYSIIYTDGDETVPLVSAINTIGSKIYFTKGFSHESLPSSPEIREGVISLLKGEDVKLGENITEDVTSCKILGKIPSVHSPASLHIYDEDGNHTGINEDGDVEYGVEGVSFDMIDDVSYVFLPDGEDYKVIIKAEDTGGYDFKVEEQDGDTITDIKSWTMVPLKTLESISELIFEDGKYSLKVDDDGDGKIDNTYEESFDGTEEAKKITTIKENKRSYSGSYLAKIYNSSDTLSSVVDNINSQTGKIEDSVDNKVQIEDEEIEEIMSDTFENEEYKDVVDEDTLLASVGDTNSRPNLIWPALFLFGVVLILLAKNFIKL